MSETSIEVTPESFADIVIEGSSEYLVMVDYWADWCAPCKMLMPILEKLASAFKGDLLLAKLDTVKYPELSGQHGIRSLPTVVLYQNGTAVDQFTGALPESEIRTFLAKYIVSGVDVQLAELQENYSKDPETTITKMSELFEQQPQQKNIVFGFIEMLLQHGDFDSAEKKLNNLSLLLDREEKTQQLKAQLLFAKVAKDNPLNEALKQRANKDALARYQLAANYVINGQFDLAIDSLFQLLEQHRTFQEEAARKGLIAIFTLIDDEQAVKKYRRQLFSMLH